MALLAIGMLIETDPLNEGNLWVMVPKTSGS